MFKKKQQTHLINSQQKDPNLATITQANQTITCPPQIDANDFISYQLCEFVEQTEAFFNIVKEECNSAATCDIMQAGLRNSYYLWDTDSKQNVKASCYCEKVLVWTTQQLQNEQLFAETENLPKDFLKQVKKIYQRVFRVWAHIYVNHYANLIKQGCDVLFQQALMQLIEFCSKYQLLEQEDLDPVKSVLK
ncbi:Mob1-like_protein [Hexamita inflata]|uniref:Mob1-like protein n=1 Tax=Hexamita inflata TaxID=28002 RepID=A0AA86URP9_9EUKA|nr:Mob1-like protein [Hexamita inflata]